MKFEVKEAKLFHCGEIIRQLREEHQRALITLGARPHRAIRSSFEDSYYRKAWFIDGTLCGMGGVCGSSLSTEGMVWLALTEEAMAHPLVAARTARRYLDALMVTKHRLFTHLIPEDKLAMRFAIRLGFELDHSTPIPVGNGTVLSVSYSRDAKRAA